MLKKIQEKYFANEIRKIHINLEKKCNFASQVNAFLWMLRCLKDA